MMNSESIASRAVGALPISLPTSLAIESAIGTHPEIIVATAPVLKYPELWINIRTLFRNFMGALDKDTAQSIISPDIAEALSGEMDMINSIIGDATNGKTKVIYYYSNYQSISTHYPRAAIRMDNTPRQKEYTAVHNQAIELLAKARGHDIFLFDLKLKPTVPTKALIITNYAYDLLSHKSFNHLTLLESHTGHLKEYSQFYTKYLSGNELSQIPFREDFIQVFGDTSTFRPMDVRLRRELLAVAAKYSWSSVTTYDKLVYGINQVQNPHYKEVLKSILIR